MTASEKLPIDRIGRYRVTGRLGAGGMGTVYRAVDETLQRDVAIKVLASAGTAGDDERLQRFLREARALAALSHPNVSAVLDVGQEAGTAYLVMELVEGSSLRHRARGGRLRPREILSIAKDVARGLGAAHARGLVHRDVKPDNVVVSSDGSAKLVDFGLAKAVVPEKTPTPTPDADALTVEGAILGTPQYMAPEQARGAPIDARADVFSFGALLYELVAGRPAFAASSVIEALVAVQTEDPQQLGTLVPGVPVPLTSLVHASLDRDPQKRPPDGKALLDALEVIDWKDEAASTDPDIGLAETMASTESLEKLKSASGSKSGARTEPDVREVQSQVVATPLASGSALVSAPPASRTPMVLGAVAIAAAIAIVVASRLAPSDPPPPPSVEVGTARPDEPRPPRITPIDASPIAGAGRVALLRDGSGVLVGDRGALRIVGWDGRLRESIPVASEFTVTGETATGRYLVAVGGVLTEVGGDVTTTLDEDARRSRLAPDGTTIAIERDDTIVVGAYADAGDRTVVHATTRPTLFAWSPDSSRLLVGELDVTGSRREVSIVVVGRDGTRGPVLREGSELAGPYGPSLGWRDDDTVLFARHVDDGAELVELDVDAAGRAVGDERVVLPSWTMGFPTELVTAGDRFAIVATHETRTLLEADVRDDGTLATPRALTESEEPIHPVGFLPDGTLVIASYVRGWTIETLASPRETLATIGGDLLAAAIAGEALVFLRPAGDRRWEAVRRTTAGEAPIVPAERIPACDAPLLDCDATRCVVATAAGTELELTAFAADDGHAIGTSCIAAPGAAGSVRAVSVDPREPLTVVFSRNGDHRLVRVVMDGCAATEREIDGAGLQFVAASADGSTIATSISHGSSERRLLRIPAEGATPELLLSENAWLYRPLLAAGSHHVVFGRRNDRANVYVVEVSP